MNYFGKFEKEKSNVVSLLGLIIDECENQQSLDVFNDLRVRLHTLLDSKLSYTLNQLKHIIDTCFRGLCEKSDPEDKEFYCKRIRYYAEIIRDILESDTKNLCEVIDEINHCNDLLESLATVIRFEIKKNIQCIWLDGNEFPASPHVKKNVDTLKIKTKNFFSSFDDEVDLINLREDALNGVESMNKAKNLPEQQEILLYLITKIYQAIDLILSKNKLGVASTILDNSSFCKIYSNGSDLYNHAAEIFQEALKPKFPQI